MKKSIRRFRRLEIGSHIGYVLSSLTAMVSIGYGIILYFFVDTLPMDLTVLMFGSVLITILLIYTNNWAEAELGRLIKLYKKQKARRAC